MGNKLFRAAEYTINYHDVPTSIVIDRPRPGEGYYLDAAMTSNCMKVYTKSGELPKIFYPNRRFKEAIAIHTEFIKQTIKYGMLSDELKKGNKE